jgi:hypothetical protein
VQGDDHFCALAVRVSSRRLAIRLFSFELGVSAKKDENNS